MLNYISVNLGCFFFMSILHLQFTDEEPKLEHHALDCTDRTARYWKPGLGSEWANCSSGPASPYTT